MKKETKARGNPLLFELIHDLDTIKKKAGVSLDITKIPKDKRLKFQKEAESFLDSFATKISYGRDWSEQKVRNALLRFDSHPWENFVGNKVDEEPSLESQKKPTTSGISTMQKDKGLEPEKKPNLGELEKLLHNIWRKGTTEGFLELVHQNSDYDRVQAGEYVARLIDEGKMGYDPDGWLVWV